MPGWKLVLFALSEYDYEDMTGLEACIICHVKIWLWGHDGVGSLNLPCQNMFTRKWQGWKLEWFALSKNMINRTWRGWKLEWFALSNYDYVDMTGLEAWIFCLVKLWLWGHDGIGSLNLPCQNMIMRTWQGWKLEWFALSKYDYEDMMGLEAWMICHVKIWLWGHDGVGSLYYVFALSK